MPSFYVDFSGYCEIEAKDYEDAKKEFWDLLVNETPLPNGIFEIDGVEKQEDGD